MDDEVVSPVEQRKRSNAQRQADYRARKAAEKETGEMPVQDEDTLKVEVKNVPPKAPVSLRERLGFGKKQEAATKAPARGKKTSTPNILVTALPTLIAGFVASYAKDRLPEEYQPVAPTTQEVTAIVKPLCDILGRRVSIAAKASQDAIDITNALLCAMAYSVRAYVTYVEIKKKQRESNVEGTVGRPEVLHQEPFAGTIHDLHRVSSERPESVVAGSNGSHSDDDTQSVREYEAGLIADMLRRDKQGRDLRGFAG